MKSDKPQNQSLAVAYSIKRKPKKMAKGGIVSAKEEARPMPNQKTNDSKMAAENSMRKPLVMANATDNPSIPKPKTQPIRHPRMAASNIVQARLRDQEDDLQMSASPTSDKEQPSRDMDEMDADKHGPETPSLHMKKMAEGGMINDEVSMNSAEEDMDEHPADLEADNDMMGDKDAMSGQMSMLAEGGEVEDDLHDSIAAAIMARKDRQSQLDSDSDEDRMLMADGGMVDLSRNADEDANKEDQLSFKALKKENYSESEGLEDLDQPNDSNEHGHELSDEDAHDMVSSIRRKMSMKRQFRG